MLAFLMADTIFMILHFDFSYMMHNREREAMYSKDKEERNLLYDDLFYQYGFLRSLIKSLIYYSWYLMGFFTPYWIYHIVIFILNYIQSVTYQNQLKISEFSFGLKLSAYFYVYLSILSKLAN